MPWGTSPCERCREFSRPADTLEGAAIWASRADTDRSTRLAYDGSADERTQGAESRAVLHGLGFYKGPPVTWLDVRSQSFTIFYPEEVHAPLGWEGEVHKAVVKVRVDW